MTHHPHNSDAPHADSTNPESRDPRAPCRQAHADISVSAAREDVAVPRPEVYDLSWVFLCWCWEAGYRDWTDGVRELARVLRGLERVGFIERRTLRRAGWPTHHGFVLTAAGQQATAALSGDWIKESGR